MISVVHLGMIDYATALRLQQKLVDLRKRGRIRDVLLLLEHSPVITLGRNAKAANVVAPADVLAQRGVDVFDCDRGGDVTFHGPGQLVGYPIFDLRGDLQDGLRQLAPEGDGRRTLGAIEYVRRLEEVLMRTCGEFRIPTERVTGLTGVWTSPDVIEDTDIGATGPMIRRHEKEQAKIAAIGVHISRAVTSHGFALNVNTDLSFFDLIVPCGIRNKSVTSLERELGRKVPVEDVGYAVARNFGRVFQSQILWVETLEALLDEKVGVPVRPPEELRRLHNEEESFWA